MSDIERIKGNIRLMIDGGASEAEIDSYIADEGVTIGDLTGAAEFAPPAPEPQPDAPETYSGAVLPMTWKEGQGIKFDLWAGLTGAALRGASAPGDVMTGKLDLAGPEAIPRLLETTTLMSPISAAGRAAGAKTAMEAIAKPKPKIPTRQELENAARAGYKKAEGLRVSFKAAPIQRWAAATIDDLNQRSQIAENYPEVHRLLEKLANPKIAADADPSTAHVTLGVINELHKELGRLAGNPDPGKSAAAYRVQKSLDDFHSSLTPDDLFSGLATPQEAARILKEARANRAAAFRAETIDDLQKTISRRTAAAGSGQNFDNQTRQKLTNLLESRKKSRGLNADEVQAIDDVIEGRISQNVLRYFGNLFGGGGGIMSTPQMVIGGAAGFSALGPEGIALAAVPPAIGATARQLANRGARKNIERISELFRSRSPLAQKRGVEPTQLRGHSEPAPSGVLALPSPDAAAPVRNISGVVGPTLSKAGLLSAYNAGMDSREPNALPGLLDMRGDYLKDRKALERFLAAGGT